jgi:hypothetical protein
MRLNSKDTPIFLTHNYTANREQSKEKVPHVFFDYFFPADYDLILHWFNPLCIKDV